MQVYATLNNAANLGRVARACLKTTSTDPVRAAESFTSITEAAQQASSEINLLVALLADWLAVGPAVRPADLRIINELVTAAARSERPTRV